MRDVNRIDKVLDQISKLWHTDNCKDLRLWQLMCLLENRAKEMYKVDDVWELEDGHWLWVIDDLRTSYLIGRK
ncbi:MAG: hypothetical protein ACRC1P_09575 [Cellulosilyticaceae bacterium]